jgi:hypothetical protein
VADLILVRPCVVQRGSAVVKWSAASFAVLTVTCVVAMFWISRSGDALLLPIPLDSGFATSREFHVPQRAKYEIELRCSRVIPFEQLQRALHGGNRVAVSLSEDGVASDLHRLPEPVLDKDFGNLGFAKSWISQDIAVFAGDPDKSYKIDCTVVRPLPELNVTKPTLIVRFDPLENEARAFGSFLLFAAGVICAVVALLLALLYFWMCRRARARPNQAMQPTAGRRTVSLSDD